MRSVQIAAGPTFVAAWIVGLVLAASGPSPDDSAATITRYFADNEHTAMVAHLLIDGVAGLAIAATALSLHRFLPEGGRLRQTMLLAGLGAALASLGQMAVGEALTYGAANGSSSGSVKSLFTVLNEGDTMKIALLAVMIAAASTLGRRSGAFPRWFATAGLIFAPLLAVSGLAFPLGSGALYASLDLTLLGLLTWVVVVTVVVARRPRPADAVAEAAAVS